ncbi:MAG: S8 family serine peptidase, partial [Mycetocola sp.]
MDSGVSPTKPRVHELRIGVQSSVPLDPVPRALRDVLDKALADWHIEPLFTDASEHWLIRGFVDDRVGTAAYARFAHTLVQQILSTGAVARVEADLPVTGFARDTERAAGSGTPQFPPGSEDGRWARDVIRCADAWTIEPTRGGGIRIGQPDTGYTLHPNLGSAARDLTTDCDVIDDDDDARDPLVDPSDSPWPLPFPGHGTTTASVMVGRGSEETGIVGVAPGSRVVPLRAVESVVQL